MKDALGQDIQIDQLYGHSTRTSGFVTVVIGRATETNDKGVVLSIIQRGQSSFDNTIKKTKIGRKIITVLSNSLFPVSGFVSWAEPTKD